MEFDLYNWLLVFMRLGAFLTMLPFFSATNFPMMMRVGLAAITAMLLAPLVPGLQVNHLPFFSLLGVLFQEVSVGFLLGFVARMVFYAADIAGMIIASQLGLSMAAVMNPASGQTSQIPGTILFFLAAVVMLTLNLHHWLLLGFQRTYTVLPIGGAHLGVTLFEAIVKHTGLIFAVALQISAPVIAVSFVVTLVFAVLSRAVPQMNVFAESFAFRIAAGLIVFGFTLQLMAQHVMNYLHRLPDDLLSVAQMLGGG
jgi:flagellar biosynthesis protein FliR